ncbi:hypothetical protein PTI98_011041 [Pleurotus ostreatus]|nr:hypothetical protein PTI98_011041 [Pleurotus ostreatus]
MSASQEHEIPRAKANLQTAIPPRPTVLEPLVIWPFTATPSCCRFSDSSPFAPIQSILPRLASSGITLRSLPFVVPEHHQLHLLPRLRRLLSAPTFIQITITTHRHPSLYTFHLLSV